MCMHLVMSCSSSRDAWYSRAAAGVTHPHPPPHLPLTLISISLDLLVHPHVLRLQLLGARVVQRRALLGRVVPMAVGQHEVGQGLALVEPATPTGVVGVADEKYAPRVMGSFADTSDQLQLDRGVTERTSPSYS